MPSQVTVGRELHIVLREPFLMLAAFHQSAWSLVSSPQLFSSTLLGPIGPKVSLLVHGTLGLLIPCLLGLMSF